MCDILSPVLLYFYSTSVPTILVRCVCFRSRKKTSKPYEVTLRLTAEPRLQNGRCTCPAGSAGYCNHLMAVLENVVLLQNGGYREAPEQLAPTELPQQWRRPRQAMAPELVMDLNWRMVADGRPDNPLPCRLYDTRKRARTESEQRKATAKLGRSLQEFNISKSFVESLLEATTCTYVDTQFGRAPRGSAMEVQLALHPSSYKTLVSLESCERGRLAAPTPLCLFGGVDQWSPGPDNDVEFLEVSGICALQCSLTGVSDRVLISLLLFIISCSGCSRNGQRKGSKDCGALVVKQNIIKKRYCNLDCR